MGSEDYSCRKEFNMENKNPASPRPTPPTDNSQLNEAPTPQIAPTEPTPAYNPNVFQPQSTPPATPISPDTSTAPPSAPGTPLPALNTPEATPGPVIAPMPVSSSVPENVPPQTHGEPNLSSPAEAPNPAIVSGSFSPTPTTPQQPTQYPVTSSTPPEPPNNNYPPVDSTATSPKDRKRAFIFLGLSAFLVVCIAVFVLAFYIPNLPKNVWATGLTRTGKETDLLIEKLEDPKAYKALEKSSIAVKGKGTTDGTSIDINLDSKYDSTKSNSNLDVNGKGNGKTYKLNAQVKTVLPESATLPNIYFKISGFSSLGLDEFFGDLKKYDNTWVAVEQDFYNSLIEPGDTPDKQDGKNVTQQDITSVLSDLNTVAKEYIFTNDPEKAVIEMVSYVGTEESEGIKAKHYKAKINKSHAVAYCKASAQKVFANKSFKRIAGEDEASYKDYKDDTLKSCDSSIKDSELDRPFDMWIDSKYKVIHKVRVTTDFSKENKKNQEEKQKCIEEASLYDDGGSPDDCKYYDSSIKKGVQYSEFGQIFKSKSQIKLFVHDLQDINGSKTDNRLDVSIDTDKLQLSGDFVYLSKPKEGKESKVNINMISKPYDGKVETDKPAATIPLQQILNELGIQQ